MRNKPLEEKVDNTLFEAIEEGDFSKVIKPGKLLDYLDNIPRNINRTKRIKIVYTEKIFSYYFHKGKLV